MAFDDAAWTINEFSALIGAGVSGVKSIQRGTETFTGSPPPNKTVNFGQTIDASKAVVILRDSIVGASNSSANVTVYGSYLVSISNASMVIAPNYAQTGSTYNRGIVSWQLIEFY